jgi:hypothetical protein
MFFDVHCQRLECGANFKIVPRWLEKWDFITCPVCSKPVSLVECKAAIEDEFWGASKLEPGSRADRSYLKRRSSSPPPYHEDECHDGSDDK